MGIIASVWTLIERKPLDMQQAWVPLGMWALVAVMFTSYQLLNHLVAFYCSLAERTVFTNLCPVVSLMFEATVMPKNLRASVNFRSKLALALLVIGAIAFSIQYPDFTVMGIIWASLMVLAVVPYRLAQRYTLSEAKLLPVMLLVAYDGFFLCTPSTAIAAAETKHYLQTWEGWMSDTSIPLLLILSIGTFITNHACALLVLQMNSATALQVYQNLSNFVVVALGIVFFGDNVLTSPVTLVGLIMCLVGGLWYAIEVQPKSAPEKTVDDPKDEVKKNIKV